MRKKWVQFGVCLLFFIGAFWFSREAFLLVQNSGEQCVVAIDPGHGGMDGGYTPGEIDGRAWTEKEINLSVSLLLKEKLEAAGYKVILTREEMKGCIGKGTATKKGPICKKE